MERQKPTEDKKKDKQIYQLPDEKRSCDKGNHKDRSIANQPNHLKFWKKKKSDALVKEG